MKKLYVIIYSFVFLGVGTSYAQHATLLSFNDTNGKNPQGNLTLVKSKLYGMAFAGGLNGMGCIFSIDTTGGNYKDLFDFSGANGANPRGSLIISGKTMYGMTSAGGTNNDGRVFSIDTNGTNYTDLLDFNGANGNNPYGSLTHVGNKLVGMTSTGGAHSAGNIFSIDTNGAAYTDVLDFDTANGASPYGSLMLSGHKLYGMTYRGGANDSGCIFSIDTNSGSAYKDLFDFTSTKGYYPHGDLIQSGKKLFGMTWIGGSDNYGVVFSIDTNGGNSYKVLLDFDYTNGGQPQGSLTLSGNKSVLYGMTFDGGLNTDGLIFLLDTNGSGYKDLFNFDGIYGTLPYGSLTLSGRNLYGMTAYGGDTYGVIFGCDTLGSATGINNLTVAKGTVNVYPNPSNGIFTIALSHAELVSASQTITVYNSLGEKVFEALKQVQGDNTINLTNQPNGVYLYRVIDNSGQLIAEGKFMIQK
jgi:uncharacterized repeat protein (TIGR03803 family)